MLIVKAIIYRFFRMIIVFMSSFFILGDTSIAISIMSVDVLAATVFYYLFDKYWDKIAVKILSIVQTIKYRKLR